MKKQIFGIICDICQWLLFYSMPCMVQYELKHVKMYEVVFEKLANG